jgi:hypothetical protein
MNEKQFPEIIGRYFEGFCPVCSREVEFISTEQTNIHKYECYFCNCYVIVDSTDSEVVSMYPKISRKLGG